MWFKKRRFMDWESYKDRIDFMDSFYWQQSVRRGNVNGSN